MLRLKNKFVLLGICFMLPIWITAQVKDLPKPIGPYAAYRTEGSFVFVSGQIALLADQRLDTSSVEAECRRVMENISQILQTAGTNWNQVVKATIYTTRLDWFNRINAVYGEYVKTPYPARETVGVCELPKKARIEISVVARQP